MIKQWIQCLHIVHGNMEELVTKYKGGKYFAVAKEERHEGKKDSEKKRHMKDRTLWKGRKVCVCVGGGDNQKQNMESFFHQILPNKQGHKEVLNLSSAWCQAAQYSA